MMIIYDKKIFARNLQRYMDSRGKTRRDVCDDLGFSYYTYSDWVNGKKFPRIDKIEMLADYFGIEKSDLIEEKPITDNGLSDNRKNLWSLLRLFQRIRRR